MNKKEKERKKNKKSTEKSLTDQKPKRKIGSFLRKVNDNTSKLNRIDLVILGILMLFYTVISFWNLGTLQNPQTFYQFMIEGEEASVEIPGVVQYISKVRYYTGPETGTFSIMVSSDGETYREIAVLEEKSVFAWEDLELGTDIKKMKFVAKTPGSYLGEIQLYDKYGEKVLVKASDDQSIVIADESNTVPAKISNLNSSYFDEIYFARSAYEYVNGIKTMEWVHPPLGKLIMAIPILLFGMNTFSYRLMGALAGLAMIPVLYILAKRIFKSCKWATLAGILMTFDCFHFAQTRIATVDSFLVLFIMLSALFMYQYISLDKLEPLKKKIKNLALSGLFMGCAISTKWTGLYAGLSLAIIFFVDLLYKYTDKRKKKDSNQTIESVLYLLFTLGIVPIIVYYLALFFATMSLATTLVILYYVIALFIAIILLIIKLLKKDKSLWKLFASCIIFFIVVPIIIYVLGYLLFPTVYNYSDNSILGIINQIKDMYKYHSTLTEGHEFSSAWYTWPAMIKPVWYYIGYYGGNIKATIVGIGNPAIWWFGIVAMIFALLKTIFNKCKNNWFIIVFIACTWLPYIFIDRAMFMYHFFPTLPFVMLAIVSLVKWITAKLKNNGFYIFYIAVVILLFVIFYPVISGMVTTSDYINSVKWLSSWIF